MRVLTLLDADRHGGAKTSTTRLERVSPTVGLKPSVRDRFPAHFFHLRVPMPGPVAAADRDEVVQLPGRPASMEVRALDRAVHRPADLDTQGLGEGGVNVHRLAEPASTVHHLRKAGVA